MVPFPKNIHAKTKISPHHFHGVMQDMNRLPDTPCLGISGPHLNRMVRRSTQSALTTASHLRRSASDLGGGVGLLLLWPPGKHKDQHGVTQPDKIVSVSLSDEKHESSKSDPASLDASEEALLEDLPRAEAAKWMFDQRAAHKTLYVQNSTGGGKKGPSRH